MKKILFPLLVCFATYTNAQQDFFALTGKNSQGIVFNDFRSLNINTGISGEKFLSFDSKPVVFSEVRNMNVSEDKNSYHNAQSTSMATLAFDGKKHLFYMPLYSGNIYTIDMDNRMVTLIESNVVKTVPCDINTHFTRMTVGYDGNIYALNNAGSQFLKISQKAGKYIVEDLGAIKDDIFNTEFLLKNMNTGFGGDMIADTENNFYVFSASGNVFKIDTKNLKAKFIGKIKGIPESYSINGSAVDSRGNVILGSSKGGAFYEVSLNDFQAKISKNTDLYIYDLASNYLVSDSRVSSSAHSKVDVYPTKVSEGFIHVQLNNQIKGNVSVDIYDALGNKIIKKMIKTNNENVEYKIDLNHSITGFYIVNILDEAGKILLTKKILVE